MAGGLLGRKRVVNCRVGMKKMNKTHKMEETGCEGEKDDALVSNLLGWDQTYEGNEARGARFVTTDMDAG